MRLDEMGVRLAFFLFWHDSDTGNVLAILSLSLFE